MTELTDRERKKKKGIKSLTDIHNEQRAAEARQLEVERGQYQTPAEPSKPKFTFGESDDPSKYVYAEVGGEKGQWLSKEQYEAGIGGKQAVRFDDPGAVALAEGLKPTRELKAQEVAGQTSRDTIEKMRAEGKTDAEILKELAELRGETGTPTTGGVGGAGGIGAMAPGAGGMSEPSGLMGESGEPIERQTFETPFGREVILNTEGLSEREAAFQEHQFKFYGGLSRQEMEWKQDITGGFKERLTAGIISPTAEVGLLVGLAKVFTGNALPAQIRRYVKFIPSSSNEVHNSFDKADGLLDLEMKNIMNGYGDIMQFENELAQAELYLREMDALAKGKDLWDLEFWIDIGASIHERANEMEKKIRKYRAFLEAYHTAQATAGRKQELGV